MSSKKLEMLATRKKKRTRADAGRENGPKGGRPKGSQNKETLIRREILRGVHQRLMRAADLLLDAQFTIALGQTFLYKIEKYYEKTKDKNGKDVKVLRQRPPKQVTSEIEIRQYIESELRKQNGESDPSSPEDDFYFITAKEPDNSAIKDMFSRVFGKSIQPVALVEDEGLNIIDDESKAKADKVLGSFFGNSGTPRARRKKGN